MQQVVSITSQGQLTIPKLFLRDMGIFNATKAVIQKTGEVITVMPRKDFWALGGSLKSDIKLTNSQLKKARESFSENWAQM
ncbi:MAG: hypothetical protein UU32_C0026G0017 [Candidatus Woesebacteria bacterium GW2011_GWB1_41_10]|uniref:SpoVT-AbrB domain-containing protein n=1 Tax=Candidatus Woesebacteria bacterium GW2011_GWB1_41_10 TaxID=1618577 RepID=A0A0G0UAC2_9BACT|nr:MAG: hypothetical protein UU32_C0026G0017 [Candidatus Woesebacteria bacterium GW2011_GWB1_41_10]